MSCHSLCCIDCPASIKLINNFHLSFCRNHVHLLSWAAPIHRNMRDRHPKTIDSPQIPCNSIHDIIRARELKEEDPSAREVLIGPDRVLIK